MWARYQFKLLLRRSDHGILRWMEARSAFAIINHFHEPELDHWASWRLLWRRKKCLERTNLLEIIWFEYSLPISIVKRMAYFSEFQFLRKHRKYHKSQRWIQKNHLRTMIHDINWLAFPKSASTTLFLVEWILQRPSYILLTFHLSQIPDKCHDRDFLSEMPTSALNRDVAFHLFIYMIPSHQLSQASQFRSFKSPPHQEEMFNSIALVENSIWNISMVTWYFSNSSF